MARRTTTRRGAARGLDALLGSKEMLLVCGSGGVGKTTIAAAVGVAAAVHHGAKVLVLTVDPARRLADSMGLATLGNRARRVPADLLGTSDRGWGQLWAAMLDTKAGWDELIRRHAPDDRVRNAVLSNPLYQNVTSRFAHSHDYLAMEQLHDVHASGQYDLVVVDTPPSRNALDVLDAPARMVEFFESRLLKWLTVPYRSRLFNVASKPFTQIADRILGSHFLQDVAEFFILFQAMERGFVSRARQVEALLGDARTAFVVVTTLETAPAHEAMFLAKELTARRYPLGAIVANRVLPATLRSRAAITSARRLAEAAAVGSLAEELAPLLAAAGDENAEVGSDEIPAAAVASVLGEIATRFHEAAQAATREAERRAELAALAPQVLDVEALPSDVHDIPGLRAVAEQLMNSPGARR